MFQKHDYITKTIIELAFLQTGFDIICLVFCFGQMLVNVVGVEQCVFQANDNVVFHMFVCVFVVPGIYTSRPADYCRAYTKKNRI
jgi:uncharacterized membrane protein